MSSSADPVAARIVAFLRDAGAGEVSHTGDRTLLAHLIGTAEILRRWEQPPALCHAALIHSVSGTEAFPHRLLGPGDRDRLAELVGEDVERLADRFATTPRSLLFAGTLAWSASPRELSTEEHDALLILHLANLADQAATPDGLPVPWLARAGELADQLRDPAALTLPPFLAALPAITAADERDAIRAYRTALSLPEGSPARERGLAVAAAALPVVGEPCVWLGRLAAARGDDATARWWAARARRRLRELGVAWDKRRTLAEWLAAADALAGGDPAATPAPPAPEAGRRRFDRYVESLGDAPGLRGLYPDLPSRPWFDPAAFPLVRYLEDNAAAITAELAALAPDRFHAESERIERAGSWDVAFFYERGRRHDEVCDACPVTTRGIEAHGTMRTASGLIYVSRMRPGTHIQAHRGPTNLRVRCHLGVTVPAGDCGLRVGGEIRRWQAGRCLVFDDHFEHEAFNHTDADRIVLIADLWHPGLTATEVALLQGLHRYAQAYARRLSRYWALNDAAAIRSGPADDD